MRILGWAGLVATLAGCVTGSSATTPAETPRTANVVDVAVASASAATEVARRHDDDDVVLAWKLEFVGDRARFMLCSGEDACGTRPVEVAAKSILAMKRVGRTRPVGDTGPLDVVDVLRLTVAREAQLSRGGSAIDPTRGVVLAAPPK